MGGNPKRCQTRSEEGQGADEERGIIMIAVLRIVGMVVGGWLACGLLALALCWINEGLTAEEFMPSTFRPVVVSHLKWSKRTILRGAGLDAGLWLDSSGERPGHWWIRDSNRSLRRNAPQTKGTPLVYDFGRPFRVSCPV